MCMRQLGPFNLCLVQGGDRPRLVDLPTQLPMGALLIAPNRGWWRRDHGSHQMRRGPGTNLLLLSRVGALRRASARPVPSTIENYRGTIAQYRQ